MKGKQHFPAAGVSRTVDLSVIHCGNPSIVPVAQVQTPQD
jgi:hypothetical protein